jgi:hypothetical protein
MTGAGACWTSWRIAATLAARRRQHDRHRLEAGFHRLGRGLRRDCGRGADYREWRLRWFHLDRYATQPGRRERIVEILAEVR